MAHDGPVSRIFVKVPMARKHPMAQVLVEKNAEHQQELQEWGIFCRWLVICLTF
jgi:hypothetical protein